MGLHTNRAFAAFLILYGSVPGRLLIPMMKIKDPFARFDFWRVLSVRFFNFRILPVALGLNDFPTEYLELTYAGTR